MSETPPLGPYLAPESEIIALAIGARHRDLGGFAVRRALPSMYRRLVGPFIFFDHMGPVALEPGQGMDVRPHPHIGLSTVTYLFEGEIVHRDSLGVERTIRPGDVNWMTAGRGIAHSERSSDEERRRGARIHGIQSWIALPTSHEETEPSFRHYESSELPSVERNGAALRIVVGSAYGAESPVAVLSPTLYVDARLEAGASLALPEEHEERAAYLIEGEIACDGHSFGEGALIVFRRGAAAALSARAASRVMIFGGAPLDGERHIFWNFVASSKERIERAKLDWKEGRFPRVAGDDGEVIPLPG